MNLYKYLIIIFFVAIAFGTNSKENNSLLVSSSDSLSSASLYDDLFESLLSEAKMFFSDAIIADLSGDTLDAMYQFDNVFKALTQLELISEKDELDNLKYQKMMKAVIEYYDNKVISIDHSNTGFSTAIFK